MCDDPTHDALFSRNALLGAGGIALAPEAVLTIGVWSTDVSEVFTARGRLLRPGGEIEPFEIPVTIAAGRQWTLADLSLGPGILLDCQVFNDFSASWGGSAFAGGYLTTGRSGGSLDYRRLCLSPVTLTWPGVLWPPTPGALPQWHHQPRSVTGSIPAAGAEISLTVTARTRWLLTSVAFSLVTAAAAATRQVHLQVYDGAAVLADFPAATTQIISLTRAYYAAALGYAPGLVATDIYIPIPPNLELQTGWVLRTVTDAINAGDQYSAPVAWVQEFPNL